LFAGPFTRDGLLILLETPWENRYLPESLQHLCITWCDWSTNGILEGLPDLKQSYLHQLSSVTIVPDENVGIAEVLELNEACSDGDIVVAISDVPQRLQACDIKLVFDLRESDYVRVKRELNSLRNCYRSRKHYLDDGLVDFTGFS
jgi:hypothetical protein